LPLKKLKEMNKVEVSDYSKAISIIHEPAFYWWALLVIKKKTRLIKAWAQNICSNNSTDCARSS